MVVSNGTKLPGKTGFGQSAFSGRMKMDCQALKTGKPGMNEGTVSQRLLAKRCVKTKWQTRSSRRSWFSARTENRG